MSSFPLTSSIDSNDVLLGKSLLCLYQGYPSFNAVGISHHLPTFYPPFSHHLPTKSASLGRVLGFLMTSGLREVVRGLAKNRRAPGGVAEVNTPGVYIIIYIMIKNNYILTIFNYIYIYWYWYWWWWWCWCWCWCWWWWWWWWWWSFENLLTSPWVDRSDKFWRSQWPSASQR